MKYFLDTEFVESGAEQPIWLLSVGIVSEDGRELYRAVNESNETLSALIYANPWVRENVIPHLGGFRHTLEHIKRDVLGFIGDDPAPEFWGWCCGFDYVLISQLIGFNDWPNGWPYYFRDLQQLADERGIPLTGESRDDTHNALADAKEIKALYERLTA